MVRFGIHLIFELCTLDVLKGSRMIHKDLFNNSSVAPCSHISCLSAFLEHSSTDEFTALNPDPIIHTLIDKYGSIVQGYVQGAH